MKTVLLAVGISHYANAEIPDLTVCHDDATKIAAQFRDMAQDNFAELVLLNNQATKANIYSGVAWLAQNVAAGDLAVFYYSGHGASFDDDSGDEADQREEFLCPHDCGVSAGIGTFIRDDEIKHWLSVVSAKTERVLCIFDSCHSGSATMAAGTGAIAKEVPSDVVRRIIGDDRPPPTAPASATSVPNQILLAGCQDYEQSFILPGQENSLFTTALLQGLADPSITTVQALFEFTRAAVEEQIDIAGIQQHPNIVDGSSGEWVFRD